MNLNPEFQRQLYLECSQARLIGIPSVLGIVFVFTYFMDDKHLGDTSSKTALILFLLISFIWGARQAVDSIMEENRERTWDTQRLSALGPWEMTWGKLCGSTVMVWYGGIICLLIYALSTGNQAGLSALIFFCIGSALLVQNGSLLLGLLATQHHQSKSGSILLFAIVVFFAISPAFIELTDFASHSKSATTHLWYGFIIDSTRFYQVSLLLAIAWCAIGNYRLMAQELGLRTQPWVWLGFSGFLIFYLGGLLPSSIFSLELATFLVGSGLTYIGVLVEPNDPMRIKRFVTYLFQGNRQRALQELPIWWLSFGFTLPAGALLSLSGEPASDFSDMLHFYPLAMALILLRDCGIYLYFSYGKNPQRALSLTLLSGVLLYGVIPIMLHTSWLAAAFFPLWAESTTTAVSFALLQAGIILHLLYRRWIVCT